MARQELLVEPRQITGKKVAQLRRRGILPANIYGHNVSSVAVQVVTADFQKTIRASGANEVIDVKIAGERASRPIVVHHVERHPLTREYLHADLYQVSLREKMRADVPVILSGTAPGVNTFGGILLQGTEVVHVEALPLDIPAHFEIDVSILTELETAIHVRDLVLPANVTVLMDPDVVLARVASPRVAEAEAAPSPAEAPAVEANAEEA